MRTHDRADEVGDLLVRVYEIHGTIIAEEGLRQPEGADGTSRTIHEISDWFAKLLTRPDGS